jgi:hypothetical protein
VPTARRPPARTGYNEGYKQAGLRASRTFEARRRPRNCQAMSRCQRGRVTSNRGNTRYVTRTVYSGRASSIQAKDGVDDRCAAALRARQSRYRRWRKGSVHRRAAWRLRRSSLSSVQVQRLIYPALPKKRSGRRIGPLFLRPLTWRVLRGPHGFLTIIGACVKTRDARRAEGSRYSPRSVKDEIRHNLIQS